MNNAATIIFFLSVGIAVLFIVVLYQQFTFRTGMRSKLREISRDLQKITDTDSDGKIFRN